MNQVIHLQSQKLEYIGPFGKSDYKYSYAFVARHLLFDLATHY